MNQILDKLQQSGQWKKIMRESCKKNGLKTSLVNELTLIKLRTIDSGLNKSYHNNGDKIATQWLENELKTYHWLLVAVSALSSLLILQFQNQQWELLQSVFKYKDRCFLKFQARKLALSCSKKNKHWTQEQSELLKQIMPDYKGEQGYLWNEIARKMFELSGEKLFRTGKHCRERWLNHLDPSKQRGDWTIDQYLALLNKVYTSGKKWSQFAIQLNRTEHSVKNRFNSLLIKQKRLNPDINKEEKLIKLTKKMLEESQNKQYLGMLEQQSIPEQEMNAKSRSQNQHNCEVLDYLKPGNADKNNTDEFNSEKKEELQGREDQNARNPALDILQYVRQEQQIKNLVGVTAECHPTIYSPYWPYSPNNGTPNNFINSSSPMSYYLNYNFASCFARFTSQLPNCTTSKSEQNP